MKRKVFLVILGCLTIVSNQAWAIETIEKRTETIYVNTNTYGDVEKITAYNYYSEFHPSEIVEYGNYKNFQVLTGNQVPSVSGDEIRWNFEAIAENDVEKVSPFSYLAEFSEDKSHNLPWKVELQYFLNGIETPSEELIGKSGLVRIDIKIMPNLEATEYYRYHYMMEITSSFDMTKYISVSSKEATEVNVR